MTKAIGLALGGGGARGWAHIGVLRSLEEHEIPIGYIAGTSIGALVGAIYVKGELHRLEKFAADISTENLLSLIDISFPGLGLVDGQRVREFLSGYLLEAVIEDCTIPFRCVATNFLTKKEVVFQSGPMVDAVRASISMPGVFVPCKHRNDYLVDGGVVNPVPVNVARAMGAEVVVAVNLNHDPRMPEQSSEQQSKAPDAQLKANDTSDAQSPQGQTASDKSQQDSDQSQQPEEGFTQGLVDRYETLKGVLQEQVDDWMPDPETGINIFDVIGNSINMMEQQVTRVRLSLEVPDVLINPDLMDFGIFDFQQAQPMIQLGYDAAQEAMPQIKKLVNG